MFSTMMCFYIFRRAMFTSTKRSEQRLAALLNGPDLKLQNEATWILKTCKARTIFISFNIKPFMDNIQI